MSILLPFEVLTTTGWKAADALVKEEMVACIHRKRGLEYRKIQQILLYASNFLFTPYSNGTFSISICEGHTPPVPFPEKTQAEMVSHFLQACQPVESEAYDPDPPVYFSGSKEKVEALQIQAITEGISATVEHLAEDKVRIQTLRDVEFWPMHPFWAGEHTAVAISCYKTEPTHLILRVATLAECYKTMCLIV